MFMYEYARAGDLSSHYTPHYKLSAAIHARNYIGNLRPAFNNGLHAVSRAHFLPGSSSLPSLLIIRIDKMYKYLRNLGNE